MKKFLNFIPSLLIFTILLSFQVQANTLSGEMDDKVRQVREDAGFSGQPASIGEIIGYAIQIVLSLLAIIFLVLTIIAVFKWMTASGNEETITKAKKSLKESIIGLFIVLTSYAITYFIFTQLGLTGLTIGDPMAAPDSSG